MGVVCNSLVIIEDTRLSFATVVMGGTVVVVTGTVVLGGVRIMLTGFVVAATVLVDV